MRVCVISHKRCWQDNDGNWISSGGFPAQMKSIASLFAGLTLVIVADKAQPEGTPLPKEAKVVPLRSPTGTGWRRKMSVLIHLPYYVTTISREVLSAEVIHAPQPGDISLIGMMVAIVLRKRIVARYCGSWITNAETTAMNKLTQALMRFFAGGRNVMLATGEGTAAPATDMHWTFATATSSEEIAAIRPDLDRVITKPLKMVFVGRLSPEKGVRFLLEAIAELRRESHLDERQLQLTIIGDGPERKQLAAFVEKERCTDLVKFAGHLSRNDVIKNLLLSDVCVLPSLSESYCKARLDAMLCGVPVITSEAGFGRQIVGVDGERGWIVPSANARALAGAIEQVLHGRIDWPALRQRCREYIRARTLENWAQQIGEICARQWNMSLTNGKLFAQDRR